MRTTESAYGELLPALPLAEHLTLDQVEAQWSWAQRPSSNARYRALKIASAALECAVHPELASGESASRFDGMVDNAERLIQASESSGRRGVSVQQLTQARLWWACVEGFKFRRDGANPKIGDVFADVVSVGEDIVSSGNIGIGQMDSSTFSAGRIVVAIALAARPTNSPGRMRLYPSSLREMDGQFDEPGSTAAHTLYAINAFGGNLQKIPLKVTVAAKSRGRKSSGSSQPIHPSIQRLPWPRLYGDDQFITERASQEYPGLEIPDAVTLVALGALANEADGRATSGDSDLIGVMQQNLFNLLANRPGPRGLDPDSLKLPSRR